MKWKALAAAILCFTAVRVAGEPSQPSSLKNHSAQTQISDTALTLGNNAEANAYSTHPNDNPPRWYAALKGPEWYLVVVGILTFITIAWQAVETRRAAQAAQVSAKALINSERAWVVINEISPPPGLISQPNPGPLTTMRMAFTFKNCGRTIARIKDVQIRFHTIRAIEDLPQVPDYKPSAFPADKFFGQILAPSQEFEVATSFEGGMPTDEQITAIRRYELALCAYGCVRYLDFANEPRVSQFCYVYYVPRGLVMIGVNEKERFETGGPPGYNRYT
jgi:hypothetical protein